MEGNVRPPKKGTIILSKELLAKAIAICSDGTAELIQEIGWDEGKLDDIDICIITVTLGGEEDTFSLMDNSKDMYSMFETFVDSLPSDKVTLLEKIA